ncbi:MAG: NADH-quinone oxidoreductase subunit N, partial [Xanthobacteraceae bacterium]
MIPLNLALAHCLPELVLAIGALALIFVGAIHAKTSNRLITELAVGVLGLAILIVFDGRGTATVFDGAFIDDPFGRFMKVLSYAGSLVTLLIAQDF